MSGRQRSSSFSITFNHVEWSKSCFGSWLVNGDLIKRCCISEEAYHPPLDSEAGELMNEPNGRHHHAFVEFKDKYFLPEVRAIIIEFLCGEEDWSLNIEVNIKRRY